MGINLHILQGVYGAERDAWIVRSKVVLNIHYYMPASLEAPRLGYLWVFSEMSLADELKSIVGSRKFVVKASATSG